MITENLKFKDGFPLNEDGSEKTAEELREFISKRPILESPLRLEDVAIFHDEPLSKWAENNGLISLDDFARKRKVKLNEL